VRASPPGRHQRHLRRPCIFMSSNTIFLLTKSSFTDYTYISASAIMYIRGMNGTFVCHDIIRKDSTMTLTKAELVNNLNSSTNFSKEKCSSIVESVFESIKDELGQGNHVLISGFGKWSVRKKNPRKGRNPQSGTALMLDGRTVVTFKCSRKLKENLNSDS